MKKYVTLLTIALSLMIQACAPENAVMGFEIKSTMPYDPVFCVTHADTVCVRCEASAALYQELQRQREHLDSLHQIYQGQLKKPSLLNRHIHAFMYQQDLQMIEAMNELHIAQNGVRIDSIVVDSAKNGCIPLDGTVWQINGYDCWRVSCPGYGISND